MNRTRNSLLNISTGLIWQVLSLVVGFVVRSVFIYQLGATYLGLSGLFGNILSILSFTELGFGQAIIFALYKPIAENNIEKIAQLMALFRRIYNWMFVIVAVLGTSLTPFLNFFINKPVDIPHLTIIYLLYVTANATSYLFRYNNSLLFASQKTYISTIISYYFTLGSALLQVVILILWKDFIAYLLVTVISGILQNIIISLKVRKIYPFLKTMRSAKLPKSDTDKIKKDVKALVIYKIGTLSLNSTDNIIISKFVGLIVVGLYSNYLLLCSSISGFLGTIFSNITASIGHMNATESDEYKTEMFFKIDMATFWFYGLTSICLYTCMSPFVLFWLGPDYVLSDATCFIIAFNQYIGGMLYSSFNYRQTMGLFQQGKMRPIVSAILNIVLSVILAIYFGLPGVLWGTALTRLLTNVWFDPYIVFKRGLKKNPLIYFKNYSFKLAIFVITALTCNAVSKLFHMPPFLNLLAILIMTLLISFSFFLIIFGNTSESKYLWSTARNSIKIIRSKT